MAGAIDLGLAQVLPVGSAIDEDGSLLLGNCPVTNLATRYGTPLYIYDAATMDAAASQYQDTLAAAYAGPARVAYAAKAWLCTATARWAAARDLGLDVVSGGELAIALHAGFPPQHIHLHGNNKSASLLGQALDVGVGRVVVDHAAELSLLDELARNRRLRQPVWLRVNPEVEVDTHRHRRTGHRGSKFGLALSDGTAYATALQALDMKGIDLVGLHCHLGSQVREPGPFQVAVERLLALASRLQRERGWQPKELSPGGGWAVAYTADELLGLPSVASYVRGVASTVQQECQYHQLPLPQLILEPGRSLVARAGVALYTIGAVKQSGDQTYVFVDGGLADNPRPALYDSRYTALLANRRGADPAHPICIAGPYCESGDILIHQIELPTLRPGDLIAMPVSGAYQLSMGSNYNGAQRPAVVWVENGRARLIQQREVSSHLWQRDEIA